MTTLSAEQIADFRQLAGDDCEPYDISGERIQGFYDKATNEAGGDDEVVEALTVVYMLRRLYGLMLRKVDRGGEIESESRSSLQEHFKTALAYWEGVAGIGGAGAMSTGTLDLNLICEDEDLECRS